MHLFRTATRLATAVVALDVSQSISYAIGVSADAMHDIGATLPVSQNAAARVEKGSTRPFCQPCPMGKVCLCDPHAGLPTQAAATLLEARSPDQDLIVVTETHVITVVASAAKAPATASTSSVFPRKTKSESTNAAESTTSTSGDDVETYACSAPNGLIQCPFSGFNTPAAMLPQHTSIGKPQLDQRDEPVNDKNPTSVLASILSASSLWPEGVTPHMTPSVSNPLPSDCTDSLADQFAIQLVFNPAQSHPTKRAVSNLGIWLINGTLLDTLSRLGNIVANHQLQFDAFGQAGAVYTSGFSACGPPAARVLALGGNTTFWGCNSGGFANIYNENIAPQCVAAEIRLINNQNPGAPLLTSSDSEHVGASNESPVSSESVTFSYSPATISWANTSVLPTPSAPVTSTGDVDGSVSEYVLPSTSAQPPSTTYWTEFAKHEEIAADGIFQDVAAESTHSIHWIGDAIGSYPTAELKPMQTIHWMDKAVAQETSSASARSSHWISNAKRAPLDLADEAAEFNSYLLPTTIVRAFVEQTFTDVGDDGKDTVVTVPAMTKTFVLGPKDESEAAPTVALSQITALVSLLGRLGGSAPTSVAKAKRAMSLPPILPRTINHTASTNDTAAVVIVTELATAYETATFPLEIVTITSYPSTGDSIGPANVAPIPLDLATTVVVVNQTVTAGVPESSQSTNDILPAALTTGGALGVLLNASSLPSADDVLQLPNASTTSYPAGLLNGTHSPGLTTIPGTTALQTAVDTQMTVTSTAVVSVPKTTVHGPGASSTGEEAAASTTLTLGGGATSIGKDLGVVLGCVGLTFALLL